MKAGTIKIIFLLLAGIVVLDSCKQDKVFGDTVPNTERPIIEFSDPHGFKSIAIDYSSNFIDLDITEIRYMIRTYVQKNATAKIIINPGVVYDYNDENGTNYNVLPTGQYGLLEDEFTLSATERSKPVRIHFKPSDVATGQNAIGISIAEVTGGEVSRIAGTLVIAIAVKNKYDGVYRAKGYGNLGTTNTTAPYLFEVDCDWELNLITDGPNSVYMDAQPLYRGGSIIAYGNVFPKFIFNTTTDKVTAMGDDAPGNGIPFNFPVDGGTYDSRYDPGSKTIFVKFGLNNNATWRVIDTLIYCRPR